MHNHSSQSEEKDGQPRHHRKDVERRVRGESHEEKSQASGQRRRAHRSRSRDDSVQSPKEKPAEDAVSGDSNEQRRHGHRSRSDRGFDRTKSSSYPQRRTDGQYNRNNFFIPLMSKALVTFQQFQQMQTKQSDFKELAKNYNEYKNDHNYLHIKAFMEEHERDGWFLEKYDPITIFEVKKDLNALARKKQQHMLNHLPLDINLEAREITEFDQTNGEHFYSFDVNERTILLKSVPVFVTRNEIIAQVDQITELRGHLEQVCFSEPLKMMNFERFAWLTFDSDEASQSALTNLEGIKVRVPQTFSSNLKDYVFNPVKSSQQNKNPKVAHKLFEGYITECLSLCKRLVKEVFDVENKIEFSLQRLNTEFSTDKARFDFLLLYMRRIHGFCFFCGLRCEDERTLATKCSVQHLRNAVTIPKSDFNFAVEYNQNRIFYQNLIQKANEILQIGPIETRDPTDDDFLAEKKEQYCQIKTKEVLLSTGKGYSCKICNKNFKGPEFVVKHIVNKHADKLNEKFNVNHFKTLARDNYFQDLNHISFAQPSNTGNDYVRREPSQRGRGFNNNYHQRGGRDWNNQSMMDVEPNLEQTMRQEEKVYVDYDDPSLATASGNTSYTIANKKSQLAPSVATPFIGSQQQARSSVDRQLVSYDDLF